MHPIRSTTAAQATAHPARRRSAPFAFALSALLALAACGGGGGDTGTTVGTPVATVPGATAAAVFTAGTVTGFGSVIVNGVRFDDSSASVSDDNGGLRSSSALRLGMRVEIESGSIDAASASAKASVVRFGSQLVGAVASIDLSARTFTVLGQTVRVTDTTVFDDSLATGLAALLAGTAVEVHGLPDAATGQLVATRVERASSAAGSSTKLRGLVAGLNTSAKTFSIGTTVVSYAAVASVPAGLADGVKLRVTLAAAAVDGVWQAQTLTLDQRKKVEDSTQAHLRGAIDSLSSVTSFSIDGIAVDASKALFPDGNTGVVPGALVSVEGTVVNSVLVATKVELESRHGDDDSRRPELHGAITAVDTVAQTFVLRGLTVSYAGATVTRGTVAGLVVGAKVEVKGVLASNGSTVQATRIKFED